MNCFLIVLCVNIFVIFILIPLLLFVLTKLPNNNFLNLIIEGRFKIVRIVIYSMYLSLALSILYGIIYQVMINTQNKRELYEKETAYLKEKFQRSNKYFYIFTINKKHLFFKDHLNKENDKNIIFINDEIGLLITNSEHTSNFININNEIIIQSNLIKKLSKSEINFLIEEYYINLKKVIKVF